MGGAGAAISVAVCNNCGRSLPIVRSFCTLCTVAPTYTRWTSAHWVQGGKRCDIKPPRLLTNLLRRCPKTTGRPPPLWWFSSACRRLDSYTPAAPCFCKRRLDRWRTPLLAPRSVPGQHPGRSPGRWPRCRAWRSTRTKPATCVGRSFQGE